LWSAGRFNARWGIVSGRFNAGVFAAGLLGITFSSPPIYFFAASHAAAPPPLGERELNCFWLIKALDFQQVVSKPGASYDAGREPFAAPTRQDVGSGGAIV
jgi:hypothetical protein